MIKRVVLSIAVISVLMVSSIGCADAEDTVTTAQFTPIATIANRLAGEESTWNNYAPRLTAVENRPTAASVDVSGINSNISALQGKTATHDTDIAALKASVKALQDAANSNTNNNNNNGNNNNNNGGQGSIPQFTPGTNPNTIPTSPSMGVVSQVNYVGGNSQISSYPGGSNNIYYVQRLMNQNTAIQYVKPIINISMANNYGFNNGGYANENITAITIQLTTSMCTLSATGNYSATNPVQNYLITGTGGNFNVTPGLGTLTSNIQITPASGCMTNTGEIYLSPGGYTDMSVQISNLIATPGGIWNVTPSCSYHP